MKVVKTVALVAVLLVVTYFVIGTLKGPGPRKAALDSASATDTSVTDQGPQTAPMPQLAKPVERLPASNAEQVYAPEKKSQ